MLFLLVTQLSFAQTAAQEPDQTAATAAQAGAQQTKEQQLRQLQLEQARLAMEQAQARMYKKKADWKELQKLNGQDIVTGREVNQAKEEFEDAKLAYEKAILNLRQIELDSLKAAWHISVTKTHREETKDGRQMLQITLKNNSQPVKLKYSFWAFERLWEFEKNIPEEEREKLSPQIQALLATSLVSPQIDDIFVSIMDKNQSIIAQPYEAWIETLPEDKERQLEFELIKEDVQDVTVALKYMNLIEYRDIHLKQEEPYITVLKARQYKSKDDKRRLEIVLKYGAVEGQEGKEARGQEGEGAKGQGGKGASEQVNGETDQSPITNNQSPESASAYATELNNIRVSIQDEMGAIIGLPYEVTIDTMKYLQEIPLDFELRKKVNSIIVALRYLNSELKLHLYLEPDTRHLSIISAKKSRQGENMMVQITLQNTSKEVPHASATTEEIAALNELRSIYVSLKDENGTIIAQPYDTLIDVLSYNQTKSLEFQLQKDVDEVTVVLQYLDVLSDERKVYLQKESEYDIVNISSMRFSQEGYLGASVTYDLALNRLAENEKTFTLRVVNLLDRLSFEFIDPESQSRISQVKFTQAQPRRSLSLVVHIPEELDINLLDKTMDFYVAVLDDAEAEEHGPDNRLQLTAEQFKGLRGGKEQLQLIPRGVPEIELTSTNLGYDIKTDERVEMKATLKNTGTRDLSDIRIVIEPQTDWQKEISPEVVPSLKRQEEREIQILLIPPTKVTPGDYEAKMDAECTVDNRKVEAMEKTIRIHISARTSLTGSALLVVGLVILIAGIAVLSIRLSRR
jgi:hypothetical protein